MGETENLEWHDEKDAANLVKHGWPLRFAEMILADPRFIDVEVKRDRSCYRAFTSGAGRSGASSRFGRPAGGSVGPMKRTWTRAEIEEEVRRFDWSSAAARADAAGDQAPDEDDLEPSDEDLERAVEERARRLAKAKPAAE